jgi:hypothetical protein
MDGLNHLREQSTDTFIDKILEEMYSLLIVQIQPEFLLKLIDDAPHKQRGTCHLSFLLLFGSSQAPELVNNKFTLRPPLSSAEISGMPDRSISLNRFKMRLLDFLRMLYASQQ